MTRNYKFLSDNELIAIAPTFEYGGYIESYNQNPYGFNSSYTYKTKSDKDLRLIFGHGYKSSRILTRAVNKLLDHHYLDYEDTIRDDDGKPITTGTFRKRFLLPSETGKQMWQREKQRYYTLFEKQMKRQAKLGVGEKCIISANGYVNGHNYISIIFYGILCEYVYVEKDWLKKSAVKMLGHLDPNVDEYLRTNEDSRIGEIVWVKHHTGNSRNVSLNMITAVNVSIEDIERIRRKSTYENRTIADVQMILHYCDESRRDFYNTQREAYKDEIRKLEAKIQIAEEKTRNISRRYKSTIPDYIRSDPKSFAIT